MLIFLLFILGLFVGSFLNVLIERSHGGQDWVKKPSHCVHCQHRLAWFDLVPVVSFIFLRGRCRYCRKQLSSQYVWLELGTAVIFSLAGFLGIRGLGAGEVVDLVYLLIVFSLFVVLFVNDWKWQVLPNKFVVFGLATSAFYIVLAELIAAGQISRISQLSQLSFSPTWWEALIGLGVGFGFFLVQILLSGGRWVGGGDAKLGAWLGLMLGWQLLLVALYLAYVLGLLVFVALCIKERKPLPQMMKVKVPFGTLLILGAIFAFVLGDWVVDEVWFEIYWSWRGVVG